MAGTEAEILGVEQTGQLTGAPAGAAEERPAFAEGSGEARAELPAFLEDDGMGGYELPKGFKTVELAPGDKHLLGESNAVGDRTIFYLKNIGVVFETGENGEIYFRFAGIPLPTEVEAKVGGLWKSDAEKKVVLRAIDSKGVSFGVPIGSLEGRPTFISVKSKHKSLSDTAADRISLTVLELENMDFVSIYLPENVVLGNKGVRVADLGLWGAVFSLVRRKGKKTVEVENYNIGERMRISVPSAEAGAEIRVSADKRMAGAEKAVEAEFTFTERVFAAQLEDLVKLEEAAETVEGGQLKKAFENMKTQFGRLPAGGHFRAKVTETVMSQLGAEGEKMRKARKSDEQIFEEWLKQVFIPLYRRARKGK